MNHQGHIPCLRFILITGVAVIWLAPQVMTLFANISTPLEGLEY